MIYFQTVSAQALGNGTLQHNCVEENKVKGNQLAVAGNNFKCAFVMFLYSKNQDLKMFCKNDLQPFLPLNPLKGTFEPS